MTTRQAADLRIRAAALGAPGLDVRGPVSQALARIPVPLAEAPDGATAPAATPATPTRAASRTGATAAPRVLKPFAETPWPTRRPRPVAPEPPAVLTGLTADERRVHRILLDSLARTNTLDDVSDGLTYVEKKYLTTLDLGFIDAEIAKMEAKPSLAGVRWLLVALAVGVGVPLILNSGGDSGDKVLSLIVGVMCALAFVLNARRPARGSQRLAIYQALRELALLADPEAVTSDALAQADAVIDRLAGADNSPRLRLDDAPAPTASGTAARLRARS